MNVLCEAVYMYSNCWSFRDFFFFCRFSSGCEPLLRKTDSFLYINEGWGFDVPQAFVNDPLRYQETLSSDPVLPTG